MKVEKISPAAVRIILDNEDIEILDLNIKRMFVNSSTVKQGVTILLRAFNIEHIVSNSIIDVGVNSAKSEMAITIQNKSFRDDKGYSDFVRAIQYAWDNITANKGVKKGINQGICVSDSENEQMEYKQIIPKELRQYMIDLTYKAVSNKTEVFCRETEIERVIQILQRKNKRNVCLLGEAGVGKTTIVEGIATRLVNNDVPEDMKGKHIITLELSAMLAGAKYRGDFEDRLQKTLAFISERRDCILFVDELHTIMGTGAAEGALDASSILKPMLTTGSIQLIGATTYADYKGTLEKDKALARRFQNVSIVEPTKEQTKHIVIKSKKIYEEYHGVKISDEKISQIVDLTDRYVMDRNFPDKAFDVLDEACVRAKRAKAKKVNETHIMEVISNIAQIPLTKIKESDSDKLKSLELKLKENVLGQDEAVTNVARAIRRNRVGISETNKPIGSFLFVGTTGTGKTELAKALAREWFGTEKAIVKIDMSEYMEKHSVSKLIGAPSGYVGYEQGGALTQKIKSQPYSVVLFDEVEKAHPEVLNVLLQILDEGVLTDSYSGKVNFRNTIVILTSNIGATDAANVKTLGFTAQTETKREDTFKKAVHDYFKPELLNRIDSVVYFNDLGNDVIVNIAKKLLNELTARIEKIGYKVEFADEVIEYLVKGGYSKKFGVRELKRYIASQIEPKIADIIIDGVRQGTIFVVNCKDNELVVECKQEQSV